MKRMLINAIDPEESRIAVVEDGVLQELHVELANREAYLGNIYKGKVVNIEPSIGAAFVAFGGRVNGFLHVSDVLPAYGRDDFLLDDVIEGRARVDVDDGPESMQQALADEDDDESDDGRPQQRQSSSRSPRDVDADDGDHDGGGNRVDDDGEDSAGGPANGEVGDATAVDSDAQRHAADAGHRDVVQGGDDHGADGEAAAGEESEADDDGRAGDDDDEDDDDGEGDMVEPELDVEVVGDADADADDDGDDEDADRGDYGFGDGIDERPLAMAAADPGDEPQPISGDAGEPAGDSSPIGTSSGEGPPGPQPSGGDVSEMGGEAASTPRKRRSRSRKARSKKAGFVGDQQELPIEARSTVDPDRPAAPAGPTSVEPEAGVEAERGPQADQDLQSEPAERGAAVTAPSAPPDLRKPPEQRQHGRRGGGPPERRGGNDRRPRGPRPSIDQLLKKGQEVVVQITKEGIGSKGPTLTTYVSLPGRCLVLMPSLPKCGVSRKIDDSRERRRLKRIVKELDETGSGGIGFIVRTAGINKSLEDLQRDRDYLKKIWEMVAQRLKLTKAPSLLYQESDLVLKAMRDQFTPDIADVVVDSEDVFMRIRDFAQKLMPLMAERIKRHAVTTPLFHSFGIEKEVEALYQPKIDLPNGASIVIDQAEALVAIDVNSGKYKAGGDSDETAHRTNLDAIPEIVRQLRLRDLGGLIIIDFIDMLHEKHRRAVERRMIDALRGDRARIKVGRISPFGMMEITRQRVGPGLKRTVFMPCPHCKGAGWSRTVQSKALSVLRESRALVNLKGYSMLQVFVAPAVADYLVNYKRRAVLELEDAVGKSIVFRPEPSYPIDVVHYRFLTGDGQEARIAIPAGLGVKA